MKVHHARIDPFAASPATKYVITCGKNGPFRKPFNDNTEVTCGLCLRIMNLRKWQALGVFDKPQK